MRHIPNVVARQVEALPVAPNVLGALLDLDAGDRGSRGRVLELVAADPALAVRVLSVANRHGDTPVTSIRRAVEDMGSTTLRKHLHAMALAEQRGPQSDVHAGLWRHAVLVACANRTLHARLGDAHGVTADDAYTAGLLHDIGHFVLFHESQESLDLLHEGEWADPDELVAEEVEALGVTHGDVGGFAVRHWGLPEPLVDVVMHHHQTPEAVASEWARTLVELISVTDRLMFPALRPGHDPSLARARRPIGPLPDCIDAGEHDLHEIRERALAEADARLAPVLTRRA